MDRVGAWVDVGGGGGGGASAKGCKAGSGEDAVAQGIAEERALEECSEDTEGRAGESRGVEVVEVEGGVVGGGGGMR